jgi:hypothetical protein
LLVLKLSRRWYFESSSSDLWNHVALWRQRGPLKRLYLTTTKHGVTIQKTSTWSFVYCSLQSRKGEPNLWLVRISFAVLQFQFLLTLSTRIYATACLKSVWILNALTSHCGAPPYTQTYGCTTIYKF